MKLTALIAQDPAAPPAGTPAGAKPAAELPFLMRPEVMFGMMALFLLVVWLPSQRRQKKERAEMASGLKRGAKIVTTSGIIGTVVAVKDDADELTLRSEDAKIKVLKSSVARILGTDETEAK